MIVRVKAHGTLREKVAVEQSGETEICFSGQTRVGDLLTELGFRPEDGIIVTLDNHMVKDTESLKDGSFIQLYDPIGGG